jgi:hypothetical protein
MGLGHAVRDPSSNDGADADEELERRDETATV